MAEFVINVENMNCSHCSGMVEKTLAGIGGIEDVQVDLGGKVARFTAQDESLVDEAVIRVSEAGYPAKR